MSDLFLELTDWRISVVSNIWLESCVHRIHAGSLAVAVVVMGGAVWTDSSLQLKQRFLKIFAVNY